MSASAVFGVLGNLDETDLAFVVQELGLHLMLVEGANPVVIDPYQILPAVDWSPRYGHPLKRTVKKTLFGRLPCLNQEQLAPATKSRSKENLDFLNETFSLLVFPSNLPLRVPDVPFPILILLRPESAAPSFLFEVQRALRSAWKSLPDCPVVLWQSPTLEGAAERFLLLDGELKSLLHSDFRLRFLSHLYTSEECRKLLSKHPEVAHIEAFPADQFQGQLKRIARYLLQNAGPMTPKLLEALRPAAV